MTARIGMPYGPEVSFGGLGQDVLGVSHKTVDRDLEPVSFDTDEAPPEAIGPTPDVSFDTGESGDATAVEETFERAVEERAPDHAEQVRLARVAHSFAAALAAASKLPLLDADDVAAACNRTEIDGAQGTLESALRWLRKVQQQRMSVLPGGRRSADRDQDMAKVADLSSQVADLQGQLAALQAQLAVSGSAVCTRTGSAG